MNPPIHVVIPVRDRWELTERIVAQVTAEPIDRLWIFDNGSTDGTPQRLTRIGDPRITVILAPGWGIYRMWNQGWLNALLTADPVAVAFLNNDITLPPDALTTMRDALYDRGERWAVYPDWRRDVSAGSAYTGEVTATTGTYQDGGLCGWAFMLRGEAHRLGLPLIDEGYEWWYGDDFLVASITEAGRLVCRLDGLPVDHVGEGTASSHAWVADAKVRDARRWAARRARVA